MTPQVSSKRFFLLCACVFLDSSANTSSYTKKSLSKFSISLRRNLVDPENFPAKPSTKNKRIERNSIFQLQTNRRHTENKYFTDFQTTTVKME